MNHNSSIIKEHHSNIKEFPNANEDVIIDHAHYNIDWDKQWNPDYDFHNDLHLSKFIIIAKMASSSLST